MAWAGGMVASDSAVKLLPCSMVLWVTCIFGSLVSALVVVVSCKDWACS